MPTLVELERILGQRSLYEFTKLAWHQLEPGIDFRDGWHIRAICEHLEALYFRRIKNLLINLPPRHIKSTVFSVVFPVWVWIQEPTQAELDSGDPIPPWRYGATQKFVYASYAAHLSIRDAVKSRQLMETPWFKERWGHLFGFAKDQNQKTRYANTKGGYRIATSVGGGTGDGGDFNMMDDPHNVDEGESDLERTKTVKWRREVYYTRITSPDTSVRGCVMQRVHEEDVSGDIIEREKDVCHLMLPARYEPDRAESNRLGFRDPRKKDGELLWPAQWNEKAIAAYEEVLGIYATAGQLQQNPSPRKGGMFPRADVKIVKDYPRGGRIIRFWDNAGTDAKKGSLLSGPAYTVGAKMTLVDGKLYIIHVCRGQWIGVKRERVKRATAVTDGQNVHIYGEQEPGSAGKDVAIDSRDNTFAGYVFKAIPSTGDKKTRAEPLSSKWTAGNVCLVEGDWNEEFIKEFEKFPTGKFKDQVDATSGGHNVLAGVSVPRIRSFDD